jgi:hypothetical protein
MELLGNVGRGGGGGGGGGSTHTHTHTHAHSSSSLRELFWPLGYTLNAKHFMSTLTDTHTHLQTLHLFNVTSTGELLPGLFRRGVSLSEVRVLSLIYFAEMNMEQLKLILEACPKLEWLSLRLTEIMAVGDLELSLQEQVEKLLLVVEEGGNGRERKVHVDTHTHSTRLYAFDATRGEVVVSRNGSLKSLYEDWAKADFLFQSQYVENEELKKREKVRRTKEKGKRKRG